MQHILPGATALSILLAGAAWADEAQTVYRVIVADHAAPRLTVLDLSAPDTRWTFDVAGQAKPYALAGGRVVAAVQSNDDHVHFLSTGVTVQDHGDHADIAVADPALIGAPLTGPRPFHVVSHDGHSVINFDKGGYALMLKEDALAAGQIAPVEFRQSRAHHGFVTPFGGTILSTVASDAPVEGDAASTRLGLQAFAADGSAAGDLAPCTAIHGEAFSGAYLAAGCKEGVLTVTGSGAEPTYRMLPYPAEFPEATTGTLLGSTAMQVFLGNHGPDGLVVIDPVEAPHMRRIALPFRRVDFALDPAQPAHGYVLTEDGSLHRVDLLKAEIVASARVTEAYSMDGDWNDPRPRLAMAGDRIVMSDPRAGLLRVISAETLQELSTVALGGQPYTLTVVGGSGLNH
ncbi:metallochaperone AztD [Gemmobacter fulva]|nr:metallochaperone AztD [Gemmobacter fulvus]